MMFMCKVAAGFAYLDKDGNIPSIDIQTKVHDGGFDSVVGLVTREGGALNHDEIVVYRNEAAIPSYLIVYKI